MRGEIVAFCCERSAYPAADMAGKMRLRCPEGLRVIKVPCAGRVDVLHILRAFERGAGAVLVLGCEEGACRHITGNLRAKERVKYAKMLLKEVGIDEGRLEMFNLAPNTPHKFVQIVSDMDEKIRGAR